MTGKLQNHPEKRRQTLHGLKDISTDNSFTRRRERQTHMQRKRETEIRRVRGVTQTEREADSQFIQWKVLQ